MQHFTSLWSALAVVHLLPEWIQKSFTLQVMNAVWHVLVSVLVAVTFSLTKISYLFLVLLVISHWNNYLSCFWIVWERQSSDRDSSSVPHSDDRKNNPSNDVGVTRKQGFRCEHQVLLDSKLSALKQIPTFIALQFIHLASYFHFEFTPQSTRRHFFLLIFFLLGSTQWS